MNPLASLILPPLSAIYSVITRARLSGYQRGWFSVTKLSAPVISVGNLTTGGTGKTPLVEWVCRAVVRETGKRVCVLSRGYGRLNPQSQVVVSDGNKLLASERQAGDEPFLLAQNLLGIAAVVSNPDRLAAGEWALKNLGTEVLVLDDGFQHLRLARDLDIVTIDATNPWGGGTLLPYGRLREPRAGLSRADCIVVTRTEQVGDTVPIIENIRRLAGATPVLSSRMMTSAICTLNGERVTDDSLPAQPIAAFCGVGNPESFFKQLRQQGYTPVFTRAFADHHNYDQADLNRLIKEVKDHGARGLITTAKDALKLASLEIDLPCYVLEIEISIDDDARLMKMIQAACENREG
jgi:tetraacyldisaccharide 4'-kinase